MATIQIDRLLETCINGKVQAIFHLTVGQASDLGG